MDKLRFPIFCKLYKVSSKARQATLSQTRDGDHLQIVVTDAEVLVYSIPLNRILGGLREDLADKLRVFCKNKPCLDGIVDKRTGGNEGKLFGCNIRMYPTANMLRGTKAFLHLHGE